MKNLLPIIFALLIEAVNAQTPFVQSRFSGEPILDAGAQCVNCMPHKDGVLEYRINDHRVETNTATFSIQLRVLGGDPETINQTRLAFASVRLTYNPLAFGNNAVANGQCSYEAAPAFTSYRSSFNDTTADMLTVTMAKMNPFPASRLVALDNTFQDFITMHCVFEREEEEADIAISGTDILPNMIYVYIDASDPATEFVRRNLFPLAHNSLRGLRLDGKNYAEDYARYSDGKGVFLRFSDDLNTNLTNDHFSIDKADEAIAVTQVVEASDATARVEFDQAVSDGILRSSQDEQIIDHEGTPLASGAFLAALEYDARAPRATAIEMNARTTRASTWTVAFSHALDASTIRADNLCLSDEQNVVCTEDFQTAASIQSVAPIPADALSTTKMTVVIDERDGTASGSISLAFRRNAVRGEDQRVVEEYQPALEEEVLLGGNDKPQIVSPLDGTIIKLSLEETKHTTQIVIAILDEDIGDDLMVSVNAASNGIAALSLEQDKLVSAAKILQTTLTIVALRSGEVAVTIAVNDGMATATSVLTVKVNNTEPTITKVDAINFMAGVKRTVQIMLTDDDLNDDITVSLATDNEAIFITTPTVRLMGTDNTKAMRTAIFEIIAITRGGAMVTVTATDGVATTTSQFRVTVDNTEPTIAPVEITPFSAGEQQTVTVTITDADLNDDITVSLTTDNEEVISIPMMTVPVMVSDDDATVRTARFDIDAISQGSAIVTITARDSVATTRSQFSMTVDNTEPTIAPVEITPFSAGEQQTVTVTITDADLNDDITVSLTTDNEEVISIPMTIVPVMVSDDNATMRTARFDIDAISQGSAIVTITARDSVATTTSQFSMTVDNTEPTIAPVEITSFSAGERQTVTVTITDADLNDDIMLSLTTDNGVIFITTPTVQLHGADNNATTRTAHFDIDAVSQGSAIVTITARDSVATTRSQFRVTVDNTELRISTVNNFSFSAGERHTVTVIISDADIKDDITVSLTTDNGVIFITTPTVQLIGADDNATTRTASFEITAISRGNTTVTITARDSTATTTSQFKVTVDNTEPTIAPVEITPFSAGEQQTVTVTITDADINDDITVSLTTDNEEVISIPMTTVSGMVSDDDATVRTASFDIDAISQGSAIVTITARDSVATTRSQFSMTVDNTEPTIASVEITPFSAGERQTVTVTITDADLNDDITVSLTTDNEEVISIPMTTVPGMVSDDDATVRTASFDIDAISQGSAIVTITARDSIATTTSQFSMTVDNTEPAIASVEITPFSAGERQTVTVTITDADLNDDITVSFTTDNEEVISIPMTTVPGMVSDDDATVRTASFDIDAISQGSAIVTITARDSIATTTSQFSMTVDNTEPTIAPVEITPFSAGEQQTVTVTITDADLNDDITVSLTTDNEEVISIPMTTVPGMVSDDDATVRTASFDIDAISQGSAIVTITARDSVATTTSQFSMTVDNTEPTIAPVEITPFSAGERQTVTVTITDADLNDDIMLSLTTDNGVIFITTPTVQLHGADNNATTRTAHFDIDAISQGSAIVTITARDSVATTTSQFRVTVDNTELRISTVNNFSFSAGERHTVTVIISDADIKDDITVSLTTDNGVIFITTPTVQLIGADDNATTRTASFEITAISRGNTTVTITARDSTATTTSQFKVTVDNTEPTIAPVEITPFSAGEQQTVTVTITDADINDDITVSLTTDNEEVISILMTTVPGMVSDDDATMRTTSFDIDAISQGSAIVTITARDSVATTTSQFSMTVDNTEPTIALVKITPFSAGERQTVTVTITDADLNDDITVSLTTDNEEVISIPMTTVPGMVSDDDATMRTASFDIDAISQGSAIVTITARDSVATTTSQFSMTVDNTEPTIAPVEITPFSAGEQQTVTVTITDADLNDDITVSLTTDNEEVISIPMMTVPVMVSDDDATVRTASFDIDAISQGSAIVTITARDSVATTTSQFSMTVDNTEPTIAPVEITPFSAGEQQTVTVTITDADLNDDITVSLTTDNEEVISIPMTIVPVMVSDDNATMRTARFDIDAISQGSAIVTITARDSIATTTSQFSMTVDNTEPTIAPVEITPFSAGERQTVTVTITDADLNDDIMLSLTTDNGVIFITTPTVQLHGADNNATTRTAHFDIDAVSQGSAIVTITARDSVATTRSQFRVTVDNTELRISTVNNFSFSAGERHTVTVIISDADIKDDITVSLTTDNGVIFITTPTVQLIGADDNATTRTASFEITAISRGNTTVTITARDSTATTTSQFKVTVDNTEPTIAPVEITFFSAGEQQTVTVTITDADINDDITVSLTTDNEEVISIPMTTVPGMVSDDDATVRTTSFDIDAISQGSAIVTITARDSVATTRSQFSMTVDNTEPTIASVEITPFSAGEQQTVTVTITDADLNDDITVSLTTDNEEVISIPMTTVPGMVSDDDATVRTASFDIDAISQGSAIVTITARDSIATTTSQFSMTVDNTEPTIASVEITPFSAGERQTATVTITDADLNDDITVSFTTDNEEVISIPMTTVPGMVSDDDATVRTASFDIDAISQGSAIVTITARDSIATTTSQFSMTVDNTEPAIAPVEITPFSAGERQTATVTITDADLNDDITVSFTTDNEEVISIPMTTVPGMVSDDDATVRTASFDIDAISQGSAIVTITARDSIATTTSQFSMTVDNTEPTIAPVEITPFSAGEQQTVTVTITDADLNDDITVSLTTDNEEVISIPMTTVPGMVSDDDATVRTASFDIDAISQGSAIVTITARDSIATTTSQFSMTVDNTEPTIAPVEITPFSAGEQQTVTVTITDADLNDDITVSLTTDNEEVISIPMTTVPGMVSDDDATVRTASFDIDAISQGSAIVTITARDSIATTTSQFSMTVDNTEPTIAPVEITPFSAGERQTVTVTITDADLNDDIMLSLTTDNGVIFITTPTVQLHGADNNATTRTAHFDIDAISQGSAIVTITARDSVATTTSQFSMTVDNTEPTIAPVEITPFSAGERQTVTVTITDADLNDDIMLSLTTDNGVIFITTPTVQLHGTDNNATTRTAHFDIDAISQGSAIVTITARDSVATTTSQFRVTVDNTEPTIASVEITPFSAGERQTITVTITDADLNDDITVSLTTDNEEVISIPMTTVPGMVSDDDATVRTASFDIDAISQGSAIVTITARDSIATTTSQFSMTVDNTEPAIASVEITPFSAGERQTATVTITDADPNDDITVSLTTDNEEVISIPMMTVPGMVSDDDATVRTASFDIDAISQGSAIVTITARDSVATTTSQFSMTVDNTEPAIASVEITPFSAGERQTATVTITDADLNDDITVSLTTDNEEVISIPMTTVPGMVSDDDATVRTASFDIDAISQGSAIVTITARDSVATTTSQFSMTVDNTEPTIAPVEITSFSAGERQTATVTITDADLNDDITVSLTTDNEEVISIPMTTVPGMVSDDDATVRTASFDIDAISQGSAIVTITARDSVATTTSQFSMTVDNTEPTIASVEITSFSAGERQTATVTITDADLNDDITVSLTTDNEEVISIPMTTVPGMVSDDDATVRTASFDIDAISQGSAIVTITARDSVATTTSQFRVTVDNTEPTIAPIEITPFSAGEQQTVTVTITDADLNDDITVSLTTDNEEVISIPMMTVPVMVSDDDATVRTARFDIDAISQGSAIVTITARDSVATTTSQFSMTVDNTEPTIAPVEITPFSAGEQQTVTVTITDADLNDDITVSLTTDNEEVISIPMTIVPVMVSDDNATMRTARFDIDAISQGSAIVTITARDSVATTTSQFSMTVDNTEPTIAPVEITPFSAGERQTVTVTITDADLNDDIMLSLTTDNGVIFITTPTVQLHGADNNATTRTAHFDIDAISQGSAIVTITARDSVATTRSQFRVTVDNTELRISTVNNFSFSAGERHTVTVIISDADIKDDITVSLTTDNGVIFITTPTVQLIGADDNATTRTASFEITAISRGNTTVTITARDSTATTTSQFSMTVDNTEPTIALVKITPFSAGERQTVTVTITDADLNDDITVSLTTDNEEVISIPMTTVPGMVSDDDATMRTTSFDIDAISQGSAIVTITARDSTATTRSQFSMTVDNTEPTIALVKITPFSAGERQTATVTITDADLNDDITVSLTTDNEEVISIPMTTVPGMVSDDDATVRTASFDIDAISQGSAIVTITARDSVATTTSQFSMTVDNTEPTIASVEITSFSAGERQTATVTITDADLNDDITVSLTTDNEEVISIPMTTVPGMVSDDDATVRTASFDIDAISQGSAIVTITARDSVATTTSQFRVTVDNTEPTIAPIEITPFSAGEQQTVTVTITDADLNDDITVSLTTDNEEMISIPVMTVPVMVSDDDATVRTARFDIDAISQGSAIVTITARDSVATTTSQFSMTVDNTEPTIAPVEITPFSAGEQQTVTVTITDADLNDDITVSLTTDNEEVISIPMTIVPVMVSDDNATMRTARFDIEAISQGSAIVTITARDSVATTMHLFQATVNNTTPTINAVDNVPLATGERHTVTLMISDADIKDNITIRLTTDDVAISITTPTVRLIGLGNTKPIRTASFEITAITRGSATVTITANDEVATETREFIVAVDNTIPTIGAMDDFFLFAGDRQTVIVTIIEPDIKDDITIGLATDNGVLFITTPTVQLHGTDNNATTRTASFEITAITRGSATVTITANDEVATTTSQFSVTVNNTTPTISSIENFSFSAGERHTVTVIISDADIKDDITIGLTTDNGVLFITTPTVQLFGIDNDATTRTALFEIVAITRGSATATITVNDGVATTTSQFSVTVNNTTPTISSVENFSFSAGERHTVTVIISDADIKDDIMISLTTDTGVLFISTPTVQLIGADNDATTRTARFQITAISRGNTTVTITVSDGVATTTSQFSVTVNNTKPTIAPVKITSFSAGEQQTVIVRIRDADLKDDITISLTTSNGEAISIPTATMKLIGESNTNPIRTANFEINAISRDNTTIMITASDGAATTRSQFSVTVDNTKPMIAPVKITSFSAGERQTVIVRIRDADLKDDITISLTTSNGEAISIPTATMKLMGESNTDPIRTANFEINAISRDNTTITITASDGAATTRSQFSVTVDNTKPTIAAVEDFAFSAGEQRIITVTVSDADIKDDIRIHLNASNEAVAITTPTVSLLGASKRTAMRSARFTIRALTSSRTTVHIAAGDTQTTSTSLFEIRIENTNPILSTIEDVVLKVGDNYQLEVRVTDKDIGDSITVTLHLDPDTNVSTTPSLVVVPGGLTQAHFELTAQKAGTTRVTIEASDKKDNKVESHFNVMVMNRAIKLRTRVFLEAPLP